jgi:uncharacterized protein (DUF1697 family)
MSARRHDSHIQAKLEAALRSNFSSVSGFFPYSSITLSALRINNPLLAN